MVIHYSHTVHLSDNNRSKHDFCRVADSVKKFLADLKKHSTKITNFEKNETLPLTEKQKGKYNKEKLHRMCQQEFDEEFNKDQNYFKIRDHCHPYYL